MSRSLHDIDALFKTALDNGVEPVQPKTWDAISNQLDKKQTLFLQEKYNRLKRKFTALLLIVITATGYTVYNYVTKHPAISTSEAFTRKNPPENTAAHSGSENRIVLKDAIKPMLKKANAVHHSENQNREKPVYEHTKTATLIFADEAQERLPVTNKEYLEKQEHIKNALPQSNFFKTPYPTQIAYGHGIQKQESVLLPNRAFHFFNETKNYYTTSKAKRGLPFSLTLFFAPDFALDPLNDKYERAQSSNAATVDAEEKYTSSFSTGVLLDYQLTKRWSIESGAAFSTFTTIINPTTVFAQANNRGDIAYKLQCSAGESFITPKSSQPAAAGDSAKSLGSRTKLQYAEVPLSLKYNMTKGKFKLIPGFGLLANFLLQGKVKTNILSNAADQDYENDISGLKPVYFNALLSFGAEYKLSKKLWLSVTPAARVALSSINKDLPVRSYQNFLSVAAGLQITF